jgi:CspA family cold shock protein
MQPTSTRRDGDKDQPGASQSPSFVIGTLSSWRPAGIAEAYSLVTLARLLHAGQRANLSNSALFKGTKEQKQMQQGTIRWFNPSLGYGFIGGGENGKDIFVHHSAIKMQGFRTLEEGQTVNFDVTEDAKGRLNAANVTVVS